MFSPGRNQLLCNFDGLSPVVSLCALDPRALSFDPSCRSRKGSKATHKKKSSEIERVRAQYDTKIVLNAQQVTWKLTLLSASSGLSREVRFSPEHVHSHERLCSLSGCTFVSLCEWIPELCHSIPTAGQENVLTHKMKYTESVSKAEEHFLLILQRAV